MISGSVFPSLQPLCYHRFFQICLNAGTYSAMGWRQELSQKWAQMISNCHELTLKTGARNWAPHDSDLLKYHQTSTITSAIIENLDHPKIFLFQGLGMGRDVKFVTDIILSFRHIATMKSRLISGHFKNYCFKLFTNNAPPHCPHLVPIARTVPCLATG